MQQSKTSLAVDGQGGKIGRSLVERIRSAFPQTEIIAVCPMGSLPEQGAP